MKKLVLALIPLAPASSLAASLDDVDVSGRDGRNLRPLVALFRNPEQPLPGELGAVAERLDGISSPLIARRLLRQLLPELARHRAGRQQATTRGRPFSTRRPLPQRRPGGRNQPLSIGWQRRSPSTGVLGLGATATDPLSTVWLQGTSDDAEQDDREGIDGFQSRADGVMAGFDREVHPGFLLGIAGGRSSAEVVTGRRGRDDTRADDYMAYAHTSAGRHQFDFVVSARHSHTDRERVVRLPGGDSPRLARLTADVDGDELMLSAAWRYDVALEDGWYLTPGAELSHLEISTDDYLESGGGELGLRVETEDESQLLAGASLGFGYFHLVGDWAVAPGGFVRYTHVIDADETVTSSTFTGTRFGFTSRGYSVADHRVAAGLALGLYHASGFGASLALSHERQDDYRYDAASLSLELTF